VRQLPIRAVCLLLLFAASIASAQSLRGPLNPSLTLSPDDPAQVEDVSLDSVTLVELTGDVRFYDAIEIEITSPPIVAEYPGALTLNILGPTSVTREDEVADVVGPELLVDPLIRGGKTFYQIVVRGDATPDSSPGVVRLGDVVPPTAFPIAISITTRMKGLSQAVREASFTVAARPVVRNIGAIRVRFPLEDGTEYDPSDSGEPDFALFLDGVEVVPASEYLLTPGLHRFRLVSERFRDVETTVGVERGTSGSLALPLDLALATVSYTAPRGATVYVDGQAVGGPIGDFTVPPGDHTIVVVVGDYTVTRRFNVGEDRAYSISVTMDIAVEEIK
jgi:hypothetical protein